MNANERAFYEEYVALARKYGVWLRSCGCCAVTVEAIGKHEYDTIGAYPTAEDMERELAEAGVG